MKYNQLGRSGLFVSEICLGTMTFSGENFFGGVIGTLDQKASTKLVERSVAAGVNFIDTADIYSTGQSEVMTGQAIRDLGINRSEIVLATKVFARMGQGVNDIGASRAATSWTAWPKAWTGSRWITSTSIRSTRPIW